MLSDFPRTYRVVRQGQALEVPVADVQALTELRIELELVRRFGAGATPRLVSVLNRRRIGLEAGLTPTVLTTVELLQELANILCDAMSPVNRRAISEIDSTFPQLRAGLNMESINKDTAAFRKQVSEQTEAACEDDIDAMLAAFEQATQEPDAGTDAVEGLAATDMPDPVEAAMAELAGSLEESADAGADNCSPPNPDEQPPMMTESVVAEADEDIVAQVEGATERVAETLVDAEQQLNAIACAFEAATSELGELADEVADATTAIPAGCTDIPAARPADVEVQTDPAFLAEWDSTPAPVPEQTTSAPAPTPPAASIPPVAVQPASETRPADKAASAGVSANLRFQMQQARANMLVQLDELLVLIERAERMQSDADDSLRRAKEFEQAAARAREAGQVLSAAEAESLKAQSAFEQAQQRAQAARQAWEQAQQQASAAAQTPPGRTP